jgi:hypothetical protein
MSEIILFRSQDGKSEVQLRVDGDTVWLTQLEIADLFATTKQNVSLHACNILEEGELQIDSVVKESLTTAADGKNYKTQLYSLPMILAIGYRVRSARGTEKTFAASRLRVSPIILCAGKRRSRAKTRRREDAKAGSTWLLPSLPRSMKTARKPRY